MGRAFAGLTDRIGRAARGVSVRTLVQIVRAKFPCQFFATHNDIFPMGRMACAEPENDCRKIRRAAPRKPVSTGKSKNGDASTAINRCNGGARSSSVPFWTALPGVMIARMSVDSDRSGREYRRGAPSDQVWKRSSPTTKIQFSKLLVMSG